MILDRDALAARGLSAPFGWADSVRFGELDALGHVNNIVYLAWFETVRMRYLAARGLTAYRPEDPTFVLRRQEGGLPRRDADARGLRGDDRRAPHRPHQLFNGVTRSNPAAASRRRGACTVVCLRAGRPSPLTEAARATLEADVIAP